ncbi:hypothetical protein BDV95DRAFT_593116 [Massariosphaeria phaeospora]|uniref:Uncharacterized protein n=1 Tax=Massariosphaeria phaeospora TaxID=100035 RepID=A0A7C8I979_9PLEO|nr:hypothetical protein BDV95DRAFT_593116 [Massariosphaeria phaeospora]
MANIGTECCCIPPPVTRFPPPEEASCLSLSSGTVRSQWARRALGGGGVDGGGQEVLCGHVGGRGWIAASTDACKGSRNSWRQMFVCHESDRVDGGYETRKIHGFLGNLGDQVAQHIAENRGRFDTLRSGYSSSTSLQMLRFVAWHNKYQHFVNPMFSSYNVLNSDGPLACGEVWVES